MKTVSLKRTKSEQKEADKGGDGIFSHNGESEGADLHLEDHHLDKLGMNGSLPHGHPVRFEGQATVHRSSDGPEGGRMTLKVHRMGAEYDEPKVEKESSLRGDLEKNTVKSETKAQAVDKAREVKRGERAQSMRDKDS